MRKQDLIKYLQSIKGNPEVLLWNGFVGDWHRITPSTMKLSKLTKEYFMESCRLERCIDTKDWEYQLTEKELQYYAQSYARQVYEHNEFIEPEDLKRKRYKQKQVIMLQGKRRGIKTFDRIGDMEY